MRLGRRLSTGTAEHPPAPPEAPAPAPPAETAAVEGVEQRHEYAEHTADR